MGNHPYFCDKGPKRGRIDIYLLCIGSSRIVCQLNLRVVVCNYGLKCLQ